jgi:hypothetical protein
MKVERLRLSARRAFAMAANLRIQNMEDEKEEEEEEEDVVVVVEDGLKIVGADSSGPRLGGPTEARILVNHTLVRHHTILGKTTTLEDIFFASGILIFLDLAHDLPAGSFLRYFSSPFSVRIDGWLSLSPFFQDSEKRKGFDTPTKALESLAFTLDNLYGLLFRYDCMTV